MRATDKKQKTIDKTKNFIAKSSTVPPDRMILWGAFVYRQKGVVSK